MTFRAKFVSTLVMLCLLTTLVASEEKPWREIRSPHFRLITNGSEGSARRVAREFEQMRSLFATEFPGFRVDSPEPLLVLAPQDEATTRKLVPEFWAHGGPKPAGIYFHGWEKQHALVRLDAVDSDRADPDTFAVVYHEYVHSLLHLNFRWLPTWLDEGLAQFYGFTRFENAHTYLGAPPKNIYRLEALWRRSSLPLDKFLEQRGSFTKSEDDTQLFYAQSWALTHFLTLGPGMEGGAHLRQFFNALQSGTEQKKAFENSFGDLTSVRKNLDQYVRNFAFPAGVIATPPHADEKSFLSRTMTVAETNAELGSLYLSTGHKDQARATSEAAITADPKLALAHETLGFLFLREGKDEEAGREFTQAIELDGHMYLSLFAKTMLSPLPHSSSAGDRESFRAAMSKVLDGNALFAPAYVEMAKSWAVEGDLNKALALSRTAEKVEPSRAGYYLLTGELLLRTGHPADAAAHAAYVANRWGSPDHDEAMELWNRVPAATRSGETPTDVLAPDLQSAEGTVKFVSCEPNLLTFTLDKEGQPVVFKIKQTSGGFSDTLWFGGHFTPCHHVIGLRAVLRYKVVAGQSASGDVVSWGLRDDLPPSPAVAKTSTPN
jgi:tetratricopeptide (TPR) repeat protein